VKLKDKVLIFCDLVLNDNTTVVSFVGCCSKEWIKIGKKLAALPKLTTLIAENCDSGDDLCVGICGSKSLESIRMGKSAVTQNTAVSAIMELEKYAKCNI
jgi:hypothetical protein